MAEDSKGKRRGAAPSNQAPETAEAPESTSLAPAAEAPVAAVLAGDALPAPLLTPDFPVTAAATSPLPAGMLTGILSGGAGDPMALIGGMAPTFGNVLMNIGAGIAASQEALDKSLIDTVNKLTDTKITVVTDVVQELDDDGLPDQENGPVLVTEEVSMINYVAPSQQVWKNVSLSMDMTVSGISSESGLVFKQEQTSVSGSGNSFWGFYGWFDAAGSNSEYTRDTRSEYESRWASGQVRLDATMEARRTEKLPVGVELEIGPRVYFIQSPLVETPLSRTTVRRVLDVTVKVYKSTGALNGGAVLEVGCQPFAWSFPVAGNATNADGEKVVRLTRDVPAGTAVEPLPGVVTVKLGDMVRTYNVAL